MGHRLAHDEERPAQIDVQDPVPFGGRDSFQGPELEDAGGIDQRIQPAQSLCRSGDTGDHGGIIADIHRDRQEAGLSSAGARRSRALGRSAMATRAPISRRRFAVPRPRPLAPPVTRARRSGEKENSSAIGISCRSPYSARGVVMGGCGHAGGARDESRPDEPRPWRAIRRGCRHGRGAAAPRSPRPRPARADRDRRRRSADGRARSAARRPSRPKRGPDPPPGRGDRSPASSR